MPGTTNSFLLLLVRHQAGNTSEIVFPQNRAERTCRTTTSTTATLAGMAQQQEEKQKQHAAANQASSNKKLLETSALLVAAKTEVATNPRRETWNWRENQSVRAECRCAC